MLLDLEYAAGFMSYAVRLYENMLPGLSNVLCRLPIDALMLCIYLACRLRKRFIVLFRLATGWLLSRTEPFQRYLWVTVLPNSSQTATWTPGDWV